MVGQHPTFSAKPYTVPCCSDNGTWIRSDLQSKHKSPFFFLCCTSISNQDPIQDDQIHNHRAPLETDLDQPISTAIQHLIRDQERGPPSIWALIPIKMLHRKYQEKIGNKNMEHFIGQLVQLTAYS
ncbi:hypothetical protein CKAN_01519700 [Cinnamomum micranthum f. kanehirae]|uniref:Uncharacterized protein n=1 Tax=Cinnamomum micranthum f. kanehirae TaxID=337451 RepID=A0A443P6C1_9MAGN|nr:hypothetical protein CKAN_01519700 [Cinnamomum micranthum f. kanehirae]